MKKQTRKDYLKTAYMYLKYAINPPPACDICGALFPNFKNIVAVNGKSFKLCYPCVVSANADGLIKSGLPWDEPDNP